MPSIPVCENHYQFLDVRINRIKLWSVLCPEKRSREYLQVIGSGFPTHNQRLNTDNRIQLSDLNYTTSAVGRVDVLSASGTVPAHKTYCCSGF